MNKIVIKHQGAAKKIGIVLSRFNPNIGDGLLNACQNELLKLGVDAADIDLATVPGALEVPLTLQQMALSKQYHALIALGAIIRGDTYHFEVVANESARGITEVQLHTGIPIANAILTTNDDAQAEVRMVSKGTEAAQVAIEMANLLQQLT